MISVIVPIYNVKPYLNQCINSILKQTYYNLEIILVDDGSTDGSGEIIDSYTDPRIHIFHTDNHGLSAARNYGIDQSHGDFIFFIDPDDWVEPDLLKIAISNIGSADMLCFGYNNIHYQSAIYTGSEALLALLNENLPETAWSRLYKRDCFSFIRFPDGRLYEDIATIYQVLLHVNEVHCIDYCGYHYRYREDSLSNDCNKSNITDYWLAHKQRYDDCKDLVDEKTKTKLLIKSIKALIRAWGWRNSIPELKEDSIFFSELSAFANSRPLSHFPLRFRLPVLLAKHPSELSFWLANKALRISRWMRKLPMA